MGLRVTPGVLQWAGDHPGGAAVGLEVLYGCHGRLGVLQGVSVGLGVTPGCYRGGPHGCRGRLGIPWGGSVGPGITPEGAAMGWGSCRWCCGGWGS